ncbi:unnamed protein product, partial [marine sediment metagenome]
EKFGTTNTHIFYQKRSNGIKKPVVVITFEKNLENSRRAKKPVIEQIVKNFVKHGTWGIVHYWQNPNSIDTVSGKLTENDVILVLTEDIFNFFQKQDMLNEIAQLTPLTEKGLKEILNKKEELLFEISGVFMAVLLTKEVFLGKKETVSPKLLKKFSLKEAFSPFLNLFKKIRKSTFPSLGLKTKLMLPQIIVTKTKLSSSRKKVKAFFLNKKLSLIFVLVILLSLGFFLSRFEQERNIKIYNKDLAEIRQKLILADSLLILKEASPEAIQEANLLLKE